MITINRQKNQSIVIGDDIIVTVIEIRGDKVRLGIEYPGEMARRREEVFATLCSTAMSDDA